MAQGLISRTQLEAACWRRLLSDVYLYKDVVVTYAVRCRAVALILPAGGVLSGVSAAHLHGADVLNPNDGVEVTLPPHVRMRTFAGVLVRSASLSPDDVVHCRGVAVTSPVRTAFDVARHRDPVREAVVSVDALLTKCHLIVSGIRDYAHQRPGWRQLKRLERVLALAAEGAESPMESRLRLVVVLDGKLPTPTLQHRIFDSDGRSVARLDLAYVDRRLGIEYDGETHWDRHAIRKDLLRQNDLRAQGWSLLRFTNDDVYMHPTRLVEQVRASLGPTIVGQSVPRNSPISPVSRGC